MVCLKFICYYYYCLLIHNFISTDFTRIYETFIYSTLQWSYWFNKEFCVMTNISLKDPDNATTIALDIQPWIWLRLKLWVLHRGCVDQVQEFLKVLLPSPRQRQFSSPTEHSSGKRLLFPSWDIQCFARIRGSTMFTVQPCYTFGFTRSVQQSS